MGIDEIMDNDDMVESLNTIDLSIINDLNIKEDSLSSSSSNKSIIDEMKAIIDEKALAVLVCKHANNPSPAASKPFIFYLLEKYGAGEEGGLGGYVESGFVGLEKNNDWEVIE